MSFDTVAALPRNWGPSGPIVVYTSHKWLNSVSIFTETVETSKLKLYSNIVPAGPRISTGNDVIGCFWSAINGCKSIDRTHRSIGIDFAISRLIILENA